MRTQVAIVLALCGFVSAQAQHDHERAAVSPQPNEAFNWIKALAGDWQGSYEWLGKNRKGQMNARYYLTGNGTAVVEDLIVEGNPNMTTVYHLDGVDLRATHYCAAGNQPRLKGAKTDGAAKTIQFQMVDITNLSSPEAGHVRDLELQLANPDKITIRFTFVGAGKENVEQIELTRKSSVSG